MKIQLYIKLTGYLPGRKNSLKGHQTLEWAVKNKKTALRQAKEVIKNLNLKEPTAHLERWTVSKVESYFGDDFPVRIQEKSITSKLIKLDLSEPEFYFDDI